MECARPSIHWNCVPNPDLGICSEKYLYFSFETESNVYDLLISFTDERAFVFKMSLKTYLHQPEYLELYSV